MKYLLLALSALFTTVSCQKSYSPDIISTVKDSGSVKLTFRNVVNNIPLVLGNTSYLNPFGESYTVQNFKYYISNVQLGLSGLPVKAIEKESYHLIDQGQPGSLSFSFKAAEGNFVTLGFLIGVDSARNVSGAQTGALDPLNGMFWTWNSGYIMAKLEGNSPQSNQAGNIFEYHIGGFKGVNSVLKTVSSLLPGGKFVNIRKDKTSEIILEVDLNQWWQNTHDIKIADLPVCTTPGILAKNVADNYSNMFKVVEVTNY